MRMDLSLSRTVRVALTTCLLNGAAVSSSAWAVDLSQHNSFDIPHQKLSTALLQFSQQSKIQIAMPGADINGLETPGITGDLTVADALEGLLRGTGLKFQVTGETSIAVGKLKGPTAQNHNPAGFPEEHLADSPQPAAASSVPVIDKDTIYEIIVTAQKREERAIDVPISMVAMGAAELQQRRITSVDDLAAAVPGMSVQNSGSQRRIELRGISNFAGSNSALVGVYLDEAAVTSRSTTQLDLNTYDLERIEVLRGPQGTLYGEGSAGGTIRLITNSPVLDRFSMDANVAALFTQDGAPSQRIQTAINVPLVDNELGVRVAATFDHEGGWIDQPAADRKNFNEQNKTDVRLKGLWKPTDRLTVSAMAEIHRNDGSSDHAEDTRGNYTQVFGLTTTPRVDDRYDIYNATLSYDLPAARILSTTTYVKQNRDTTNFGYSLQILPPGSPAFDVDLVPFIDDAKILTEELRLTSTGSGPWQWTVGGYYQHFRFTEDQTYYFALPGPLPATSFSSSSDSLSKSWAGFGDTSYKLGQLTLGVGLRYYRDQQEFTSGTSQSGSFHTLNPRFYAQYKLTEDLQLYASSAKGFRSGGFNPGASAFDPESVRTEELGAKTSLAGGRLSADIALFYSDYTDYQITGILPLPAPPVPVTSNGGSARIKGVEWAWAWRPTDDWNLSVSGNYIHSYFYRVNVTASDHSVGDPLDFVPKYKVNLAAQRNFHLDGRAGFVRLDFDEQGRETFRLRSLAGPTPWFFSQSGVIQMLNFNSSLQWNNNLTLGVFAKNLLNDRNQLDPLGIENSASRSRPRTLGVEFQMSID